jgi:hypothetical protein
LIPAPVAPATPDAPATPLAPVTPVAPAVPVDDIVNALGFASGSVVIVTPEPATISKMSSPTATKSS